MPVTTHHNVLVPSPQLFENDRKYSTLMFQNDTVILIITFHHLFLLPISLSLYIYIYTHIHRIQNIQERFSTEEDPLKLKKGEPIEFANLAISAINSSQIYSRCFPYLDTPKLIGLCKDVWESLSAKNYAAKQYLNRKLTLMKADPKADPDVVTNIEILKCDYGETVIVNFDGKVFKVKYQQYLTNLFFQTYVFRKGLHYSKHWSISYSSTR